MQTFDFLVKGIFAGLIIAFPFGPMGAFALRKCFRGQKKLGFLSGIGMGAGDAFGAFVVTYGLKGLAYFFIALEKNLLFRFVAAIFLIFLGLKHYFEKPKEQKESASLSKFSSKHSAFFTTFIFTITNPATYLLFSSFYAGFGLLSDTVSLLTAILLSLGVFSGSCVLWGWIILGVAKFQKDENLKALSFLAHFSSAVITGFGVFILISCFLNR